MLHGVFCEILKDKKNNKMDNKRKLKKKKREVLTRDKYFQTVLPFYSNRLKLILGSHFTITESMMKSFKNSHSKYAEEMSQIMNQKMSFLKLLDNFASKFTRLSSQHARKEALNNYKKTPVYGAKRDALRRKTLLLKFYFKNNRFALTNKNLQS